jgi:catalase
VLFDAVYVPGGRESVATLSEDRDALDFVTEAYRHCKPLSATGDGIRLFRACPGVLAENGGKRGNGKSVSADGVLTAEGPASATLIQNFLGSIAQHRFWDRQRRNRLVAGRDDETRGRGGAAAANRNRAAGAA